MNNYAVFYERRRGNHSVLIRVFKGKVDHVQVEQFDGKEWQPLKTPYKYSRLLGTSAGLLVVHGFKIYSEPVKAYSGTAQRRI